MSPTDFSVGDFFISDKNKIVRYSGNGGEFLYDVSVLTFEDDHDRDWDDELDKITDYYYENYKDFVE